MIFFASASANQNDLVEKEVLKAGGTDIRTSSGGVEFSADLETAYRFAMWTRCATRLLVLVYRTESLQSTDDLYERSLSLPWENWMNPQMSFAITETVTDCRWIRNSHFAALRLKDAVVERMRQHFDGVRPDVDRENPDIVFHLHVNRNTASWYVDFAGRDLPHRYYRTAQTEAVMSEYLAACILLRTQWAKEADTLLLDPFCGSGTICIEAALIATNTAPGLINPGRFAFFRLPIHRDEVWQKILDEAEEAQHEAKCRIVGFDIDRKAVEISKKNARNAGFTDLIEFSVLDFTQITDEQIALLGTGTIVTDPPYGIRLSEYAIGKLWSSFGEIIYNRFGGWNVSVISPNPALLGCIGMKPDRTNILMNGGLECQLAHYYVFSDEERRAMLEKARAKREERLSAPLSPGAQMAANRLTKNMASIGKEMAKEGVTCYRLYDADMPEYSAAIDIYEGRWISLQEYAAPASIDPADASRRLEELVTATERVTGVDLENIFVKRREIQKGAKQYGRNSKPSDSHFFVVKENGHRFIVNFRDYLDTGIFLDHRPVRKMIEQMSGGKRFLNLFCYTATATVHAASGGALSTVSVDASSTYLDWAARNMKLNGFDTMNHFYYREDCITWLRNNKDVFDLIFCDPPTWSNSKSRSNFDVQRDHGYLIRSCMKHLSSKGSLIFSTNFTRFKLYAELHEEFEVEDITAQTIGADFARNSRIHTCYLIRHRTMAPKKVQSSHLVRKVVRKDN